MAQKRIHPMVCTLSTRLQALTGLRNLFPPVVGLAPDPAGFASYRKSYTGQNQRGRALDFVAKSQVASKAAARLLDKIGTDNWGERLVLNGFVVDADCFLTASWRTRHPIPNDRTRPENLPLPGASIKQADPSRTRRGDAAPSRTSCRHRREGLQEPARRVFTDHLYFASVNGKTKPQTRIQWVGTRASAWPPTEPAKWGITDPPAGSF